MIKPGLKPELQSKIHRCWTKILLSVKYYDIFMISCLEFCLNILLIGLDSVKNLLFWRYEF